MGDMTQWIKTLGDKPDNLSLIPKPVRWKENLFPQPPSDLCTPARAIKFWFSKVMDKEKISNDFGA